MGVSGRRSGRLSSVSQAGASQFIDVSGEDGRAGTVILLEQRSEGFRRIGNIAVFPSLDDFQKNGEFFLLPLRGFVSEYLVFVLVLIGKDEWNLDLSAARNVDFHRGGKGRIRREFQHGVSSLDTSLGRSKATRTRNALSACGLALI